VRLLENLHQAGIPLGVDQVNVCIKVAILERVQSFYLLTIEFFLLIFFLLGQIVLCQIGISFDLADPFLMELKEFFLSVQHFFKELLSLGSASHLLTAAHLLLKSV